MVGCEGSGVDGRVSMVRVRMGRHGRVWWMGRCGGEGVYARRVNGVGV